MSKLNANSVELGTLTTAQRDALTSVSSGTLIYNSTDKVVESYNGTSWDQLSNVFVATGGTTSEPGDGKKYHTFTSPGSFTVTSGDKTVTVQMVGGGGGGSSGNGQWAGGGGGGGYVFSSVPVTIGPYPMVRGTGASRQSACGGNGNSGTNTTAFGLSAYGGGGGANQGVPGSGGGYSITGFPDLGSSPGDPGGGGGGDGSGEGGDNGRRYGTSGSFADWGGGAAGVPNYSPGPDASGYGNGGAGGHSCQNGHNGGGAGSPGIIVVSYPV